MAPGWLSNHSAADAGVALVLSGHTHGGQISPFQWLSSWFNGGFLQ